MAASFYITGSKIISANGKVPLSATLYIKHYEINFKMNSNSLFGFRKVGILLKRKLIKNIFMYKAISFETRSSISGTHYQWEYSHLFRIWQVIICFGFFTVPIPLIIVTLHIFFQQIFSC